MRENCVKNEPQQAREIRAKSQPGKRLAAAGRYVLRLLYPPRCPMCDELLRYGEYGCCRECTSGLPWVQGARCMKCGKMLQNEESEYCSDCQSQRHYFDRGVAAFTYSGQMRQSLYRMKFQNRRDYLPFYAKAMNQALMSQVTRWRPEVILPVPMYSGKRRRRGYNQSELLAKELGMLCGIPVMKNGLRCIRWCEDQKKLDRRRRMENLRGSFVLDRYFPVFHRVLLVDDVYTTGSTMDEISRILKEHGVGEVYFAVLCIGKGKNTVCTTEKLCYTQNDKKCREEKAK